jgi:hypothetical protein
VKRLDRLGRTRLLAFPIGKGFDSSITIGGVRSADYQGRVEKPFSDLQRCALGRENSEAAGHCSKSGTMISDSSDYRI